MKKITTIMLIFVSILALSGCLKEKVTKYNIKKMQMNIYLILNIK